MKKNNLIVFLFIIVIVIVFYILHIRFCPIYNLFHIPCVGCGLSRSIVFAFKLEFKKSLEYNILGIPILIFAFGYLIFILVGKKQLLNSFIIKQKKAIILIAITIFIITWIINLNNPLLY